MRNKKSETKRANDSLPHYDPTQSVETKITGNFRHLDKVGPYKPFQTSEEVKEAYEEWFRYADGIFKNSPGKYGEVWNQSGALLVRYDFEKRQIVYVHPNAVELSTSACIVG